VRIKKVVKLLKIKSLSMFNKKRDSRV